MSELVYLYGFVPAETVPPVNLPGIGGSAVEIIPLEKIAAAVGRVPSAEYSAERIEARLQDLSWVAEQGVGHETVVAWFVDHSQILPVPLFTMYSSAAALTHEVGARVGDIAAELVRLRNKREWDVKISFDERELEQHAAALSPRIAELDEEAAAASPGKRYLIEKKRRDLLKAETRKAAHERAREVIDTVAHMLIDQRTLPIPRTTDELPVILYAAMLVERTREVELIQMLEQQAARLKGLGLSLAFSGPWAPYRFTGEHERAPSVSD